MRAGKEVSAARRGSAGEQAGPAKSVASKAPATCDRPSVQPRHDQGQARLGSGCQGPGRLYLTGSGRQGRDIVRAKFVFSWRLLGGAPPEGHARGGPGVREGREAGPRDEGGRGLGPSAEDVGGRRRPGFKGLSGGGLKVGGTSGSHEAVSGPLPTLPRTRGILRLTSVKKRGKSGENAVLVR